MYPAYEEYWLAILGGGKALFKDVKGRHALELVRAKPLRSGKVALTYRLHAELPKPDSAK
jgi:hypothetical protein